MKEALVGVASLTVNVKNSRYGSDEHNHSNDTGGEEGDGGTRKAETLENGRSVEQDAIHTYNEV
jgi:hypothetical protein